MSRLIEYDGVIWDVRRATMIDGITAEYVAFRLEPSGSGLKFRHALEAGNFLTTVTLVSGEPGFTIPGPEDAESDLRTFYKAFQQLDLNFRTLWNTIRGDLSIGFDPDLQPSAEKND